MCVLRPKDTQTVAIQVQEHGTQTALVKDPIFFIMFKTPPLKCDNFTQPVEMVDNFWVDMVAYDTRPIFWVKQLVIPRPIFWMKHQLRLLAI